MKFRATCVCAIPLVVSLFCARMSTTPDRPADLPHPGMVKISSAGKSFQQGWNDSLASIDEKPGMQTAFTYNYWLDTTVVTQKQYFDVMGKRPDSASSPYGVGDDYPVYYVSWFDAVLYCNARSRAEHLDTLYVYSGINYSSSGSVYELTGLRYDLSKDGYRLPTESEWEYAARDASSSLPFSAASDSGYARNCAWFTANSSGRTHPVGTRLPNSLGLYDMAGNVFEWTNDWKCLYDGSNITNSLGALQPDNAYEKVIKGGSYNYPLMYLRPSHRSATYATQLSTACEYVGFRCARGPVLNGRYIGSVQPAATNPVNIVAGSNDLMSFIGTSNVKIVFVNVTENLRTLCYVDFSRAFPAQWEFLDDRNVYLPTLSPDGRYVAYCSNNWGLQSAPSRITIRSLDSLGTPRVTLAPDTAFAPRWWVNTAAGDTCIVYTNSACDDGIASWSFTKTFSQKVSGGVPVGAAQELIPDGSYHDGISLNGNYAVTGFTRLMMKDLVTNRIAQLFVSPNNGKDDNGSTQVCNVSISPDTGSGVRCLFLDFGCPVISTVTGSSYGLHEYVFVSTMADSIINYVHCPSGEQAWDNPKWSNQPRFAVACGRNSADQAHAIYAIDLESKNCKQLITGTELQQPHLWSAHSIFFDQDSAGCYDSPPTDNTQGICATKLLMFWRLFDSVEVIATGSSHAYFAFDPALITELKAFNMAASGSDLLWQKVSILNYALIRCSNVRVICSTLDIGFLDNPNGGYTPEPGLVKSNGYAYDSCHAFWPSDVSSGFINNVLQVPLPNPDNLDTALLGFCPLPSRAWGGTPVKFVACSTWTTADSNYRKNLATITMIADTLRSRKIHWIMVNYPVSPYYRGTDYYSLYGPSWQTAEDILQQMRNIQASNPYFHLYDANMDGNHDYGDEDARDCDHLCDVGAEKFTPRLNAIIDSILGR
jgi:uncharacterized protein (TIGR02171 family)